MQIIVKGLLLCVTACSLLLANSYSHAVDVDSLEFNHGIAIFGTLKYPADFAHFDYLNPDAPRGGEIILSHPFSFDSLAARPLGESGAPNGYHLQNDPLVVRSGDELAAYYGRLAEGIAVTKDRMTLVFRIHAHATWDDGKPITAHDVVFTFKPPGNADSVQSFFDVFETVTAIDERHVAFRLNAPLNYNHITSIQYRPIIPEHYWRDKDPTAATMVPPVTSGPYKVAEVKAGRHIVYKRRDDYWGEELPLNQGRYNFNTVRYEVYREAAVLREAFMKGMVDMIEEDDIRFWSTAYESDAMDKGWIKKIRRNYGIWVGIGRALVFNAKIPRLADRRVRKALTLSFAFEWYNQKLYHGERIRATSFWPNTILSQDGLPSERELTLLEPYRDDLPPELFEQPFGFPPASNDSEHRENLLQARDLFAEAGWHIEEGVLRNSEGEAFTLEFVTQDPGNQRILLPWFWTLERLGIQATMRLMDISLFVNRIRYHEYEALIQTHDFLMPPTLEVRANFHSTAAGAIDSRNYMHVNMPVIDHLIEKSERAETMEELIAACRALDRVVMWQHYMIPVYAYDARRTLHWDRFGRPPHPKYRPAYPDGWWFDAEKAERIRLN